MSKKGGPSYIKFKAEIYRSTGILMMGFGLYNFYEYFFQASWSLVYIFRMLVFIGSAAWGYQAIEHGLSLLYNIEKELKYDR